MSLQYDFLVYLWAPIVQNYLEKFISTFNFLGACETIIDMVRIDPYQSTQKKIKKKRALFILYHMSSFDKIWFSGIKQMVRML